MRRNLFTRWFYPQSIKNKVLVFGVIMSTIPLLLISYFYYTQVKEDLEGRIIDKQELMTENLSNEIKLKFNQTFQQLHMFSTISTFQEGKKGFYELLQQNEFIEDIVITDKRGFVEERVSRYQLNVSAQGDKWFTDDMWYAFHTEDQVYGEVEFNSFGQPVMKLAIPFHTDEGIKGIGVVIQLQKIIGQISSLRQEDSSYLYLVDQNGRVIAHQDYSKLWEKNSTEMKEDMLSVQTIIDDLNWTLVMEQPKKTAYDPINKMIQIGLMAVAITTLLISLISIYAGLYFIKPIVLLDHAMKKLQLGYSIDPIKLKRNDEMGKLTESFNKMTEELQQKSLQLEMEKERLKVVVDGIGAGLALITKDYMITWMNPTLKKWMHEDEQTLPCYTCIGGYEVPCHDCPITTPTKDDSFGNKMIKLRTANGEERIFQHRVFPLNHAIEGEGEFLLVIEDITEQKNMEEKIIQTDKLSALGLMASGFAHEVNNPLTTINVYAEDLNDRIKQNDEHLNVDEMNHYLKKIVENTERCKKITSNLLNFSRKSNWTIASVDIHETIQNSINLVEHTLKKGNIELYVNIDQNLPTILGDSLKLMQVLVNLINNSVDAMENGGLLSISAQKETDTIVLTVTDSGTGISEEKLTKVFDPFYTTKPIGKGTGLGLSVCYGIIQQFGGSMEIESELEKGTSVMIRIPIKEEKQK